MAYYVICEKHGRLTGTYNTADEASEARSKHYENVSAPHGIVEIVEE